MPEITHDDAVTGDFIRGTHPYAFRSGEWAQIVAVDESTYDRPCFLVIFSDGATDSWACVDPMAGYEFADAPPTPTSGEPE